LLRTSAAFNAAHDDSAATCQPIELFEQNAQVDSTMTVIPPTFAAVDTCHEEDNLSEYRGS
jgi:hypothetical protein